MCVYMGVAYPTQLITHTIWQIHIDTSSEDSSSFCILRNKIVIVVRVDKNNNDSICTTCICNMKHASSSFHVQVLSCLEELVAKDHSNELNYIYNSLYPKAPTIQHIFDDTILRLTFIG